MTIEQAIYGQLAADYDVTVRVSNRISPEWRREGTALPALIYSVDNKDPVVKLTGNTGLVRVTVSIVSIAGTMQVARQLAEEVNTAVQGGGFPWTTYSGTSVKWAQLTSESVERMDDLEGTDDGPRAVTQIYDMWATGA